jgi:FkbM family methyltransferase
MIAPMASETGRDRPQSDFGSHRPSAAASAAWRLVVSRTVPAGLRKPIRRRVRRLFPGPFDISAAGFNWRLYPESNYCDQVVFGRRRLPEVSDREAFLGLVKTGSVIVDVGANIGTYALDAARRVGAHGRVIAIEPNPRMAGRLRFHIAANGLDNITVREVAIAPQRGTLKLWLNRGSNAGNSSLIAEAAAGTQSAIDVPTLPLGEVLAEEKVGHVGGLKIDVEGFEDQVIGPLLDGDQTLWPQLIQIETLHRHLWQRDCVADLKAVGYTTVLETSMNAILRAPA